MLVCLVSPPQARIRFSRARQAIARRPQKPDHIREKDVAAGGGHATPLHDVSEYILWLFAVSILPLARCARYK